MKTTLLLGIAVLVMTASAGAENDPRWRLDFEEAARTAREEEKNLLVVFTGSDWCRRCITLEQEVLSSPAFLDSVAREYVLVFLDFPRDEERRASLPHAAENARLRERYGVRGYPTILLMNPEREVIGRATYRAGDAEAWLIRLSDIAAAGRRTLAEARELVVAVEAAEGDERTALLDRATGLLAGMDRGFAGCVLLGGIVKGILDDEKATDARKLAAIRALLVTDQASPEVFRIIRQVDAENREGLLESAVLAEVRTVRSRQAIPSVLEQVKRVENLGIKDRETAIQLFANAAFWNERFLSDPEGAKAWARKCLALEPESEKYREICRRILGD